MSYGAREEKMNDELLKEKEDRILELEEQRQEELKNRKWMASCPERKNSYGQYPLFEKSKWIALYTPDIFDFIY